MQLLTQIRILNNITLKISVWTRRLLKNTGRCCSSSTARAPGARWSGWPGASGTCSTPTRYTRTGWCRSWRPPPRSCSPTRRTGPGRASSRPPTGSCGTSAGASCGSSATWATTRRSEPPAGTFASSSRTLTTCTCRCGSRTRRWRARPCTCRTWTATDACSCTGAPGGGSRSTSWVSVNPIRRRRRR